MLFSASNVKGKTLFEANNHDGRLALAVLVNFVHFTMGLVSAAIKSIEMLCAIWVVTFFLVTPLIKGEVSEVNKVINPSNVVNVTLTD